MGKEIEAKIQLNPGEGESLYHKVNRSAYEASPHYILEKNIIYIIPWAKGEILRLRLVSQEGSLASSYITYKGKNIGKIVNCREELETPFEVRYEDTFKQILNAIGLKFYSGYAKTRMVFSSGGIRICLDTIVASDEKFELDKTQCHRTYPSIPNYVEIEGPTEEKILDMIKQLGLQDKPIIHKSYADLVREEKK